MWMFCTFAPTADDTSPSLPERKDMLPDSERSQMLIELGVIADLAKVFRVGPRFIDID
jgi:hypothetical protein